MAELNGTNVISANGNGSNGNRTNGGNTNGNGANGKNAHDRAISRKMSTPMMPAFMVSAPGKVIVFGEHAVVHGKVSSRSRYPLAHSNLHL